MMNQVTWWMVGYTEVIPKLLLRKSAGHFKFKQLG